MCDHCGNEPCTCSRTLTTKRPPRPWVVTPCLTVGCRAMIRSLPGTTDMQTFCKWCRGHADYNSRPQPAVQPDAGPAMTKEEFGQDLYDAIVAHTGARQALKTADLFAREGKTRLADEYTQRGVDCQKELERLLHKNTIAPDDIRRLLALT